MLLALSDPRWNDLEGSYGGTGDIVSWLTGAYSKGLTDERLGDLINEVQHQGDTSTAMYAVAPHLIRLAENQETERKLAFLTHAGIIYADSTGPRAVPCPKFLREEFEAYALRGAHALAPLLAQTLDFEKFKWAVAALAGFGGHHAFGKLLSGLDYYKGRFHHTSLGEPFPDT